MTLKEFFDSEKIYEVSLIPFEKAVITDPRRAERLFRDFDCKTVVTFLIPYYVKGVEQANVSRYAFAEDYHFYFKELSERLEKAFPHHFRSACDTSPINEVGAAVKSGLGSIGKHGLLINKRYGSFVFVAEFFSDLPLSSPVFSGIEEGQEGQFCRGCNACVRACPTGGIEDKTRCLSFINQKKRLEGSDEEIIKNSGMVWGCDVCQEVCPENEKAEETEIPFFKRSLTPVLNVKILDKLIEEGTFSRRAYAWRGESTIRRNAKIITGEKSELPKN